MLELSAGRCRYAPRQAAALFCPLHFLGRSICICISYCDCKSIFIWICIHVCNNICICMSICQILILIWFVSVYVSEFVPVFVILFLFLFVTVFFIFDKVPDKQLNLFVSRSHYGLVAATLLKTKENKYFYLYLYLSLLPIVIVFSIKCLTSNCTCLWTPPTMPWWPQHY